MEKRVNTDSLNTGLTVYDRAILHYDSVGCLPVHLSMLSRNYSYQYSTQYSFQATGYVPTLPLPKQLTAMREE